MDRTRDASAESRITILPVEPLGGADALAFIDRLRAKCGPDRVQTSRDAASASSGAAPNRLAFAQSASEDLPWTISNKYYDADVHFRIASGSGNSEGVKEADISSASGTEPAVVVLARAHSPPTSTSLASLLSQISNRASAPEVCILATLAVADNTASNRDTGDHADLWQDLALAHEFEWIHVPLDDNTSSASHPAREAPEDGIAAVVAALHAHVWPGMCMVDRHPQRLRPRRDSSAEKGDASARGASLMHDEEDEVDAHDPHALSNGSLRPGATFSDPTDWSFPSTFLPSIPRASVSSSVSADVAPASVSSVAAFEDDFAPFVSASTNGTSPFAEADSLAYPSDATNPEERTSRGGEAAGDEGDLADLFERVSLARSQAQGMDLAARRDFAARMVKELLGDDIEGLSDLDE